MQGCGRALFRPSRKCPHQGIVGPSGCAAWMPSRGPGMTLVRSLCFEVSRIALLKELMCFPDANAVGAGPERCRRVHTPAKRIAKSQESHRADTLMEGGSCRGTPRPRYNCNRSYISDNPDDGLRLSRLPLITFHDVTSCARIPTRAPRQVVS